MNAFTFQAVAIVRSCYTEKFAIPRQPGLVDVEAVIELVPPYDIPESVRGLEAFSHIWLCFVFHGLDRAAWKPTVRPPRLGGNRKVGVFASRSPYRPNPIGLSAVELCRVEAGEGRVRLHVKGADLLDGTPILDIKPYLPYGDSISEARAGYAPAPPQPRLAVRLSPAAQAFIVLHRTDYPELEALLLQLLALDPRPAYHEDRPGHVYGLALYDLNIRFTVQNGTAEVVSINTQ